MDEKMRVSYCHQCMERVTTYPCPACGYSPDYGTASYMLPPGTILKGKYLTGKDLGKGGFGITYIGMDLQLRRKVAIKEYYPAGFVGRKSGTCQVSWYSGEAAQEAMRSGLEQVLKEARKMSQVSHITSVVQVYDVFQENGTAYICMDFVDGQTLQKRLKQTGLLPWEKARDIFLPLIQAMDQVHRAGLIHRDLSPDNLMIQPDGKVRILDLGAAKDLTRNTGKSSMQVAKNGFSPLEQYLQSGNSGSWTDVYAMAATIYYSLTGVVPPSALDRLDNDPIQWELPQLTALPSHVLDALQHAMAVNIKDRTQTMEAFHRELTTAQPHIQKPPKWLVPGLVAAAAAALVIGCFIPKKPLQNSPGSGFFQAARPAVTYGDWKKQVEEWKARCTMESYDYQNGARMDLYFDEQDRQCLRIFTNEQGEEEFRILAEYDDESIMLEQYCFAGEELARHTVWNRNANGDITLNAHYNGNGDLIEQTEYGYDDQGRQISNVTVNGAGKILTEGSSTYDAQGRETYSYTNQQGDRTVSLYSPDGVILESTVTNRNGKQTSHTIYEYDAEGRKTAYLTYNEHSELTHHTEYHYRGDLQIGFTSYSYYDGNQYSYQYEYIFGPRDISFGQRYRSDGYHSDTEFVKDIANYGSIRSFVHQEASYVTAVYQINHYDWNWDLILTEGYDDTGMLVEKQETLYDDDGNKTGSSTYRYNDDGSYSYSESNQDYDTLFRNEYNAEGTMLVSTQYKFDENGEQDGYRRQQYNDDQSYTVMEYDKNYNTLYYNEYQPDGTLISSVVYRYNENGERDGYLSTERHEDGSYTESEVDASYNTTAISTFDSTGKLVSKAEYTFNADGKRTSSVLTTYYYDGSYTVVKKGENNKLISETTYDANGKEIP